MVLLVYEAYAVRVHGGVCVDGNLDAEDDDEDLPREMGEKRTPC